MDLDITKAFQWLASHQKPELISPIAPVTEDPSIAVSQLELIAGVGVDGQVHITDPGEYFEKYRLYPKDYRGTAKVQDLASFIGHVNRFKDQDSALWCKVDPSAPTLTAVLDYNQSKDNSFPDIDAALDSEPVKQELSIPTPHARFGRHRTHYAFPLSPEWQAWVAQDGKKMGQADFAAFLEDRILDVIERAPADLSDRMQQIASLLGGNFASPGRLVELSRGLALHVNERIKQANNLSTGETTISYESTNTDTAGAPLKVPNLFLIAIPIFLGGAQYVLPVRLRYRNQGGSVVWFYEIAYLRESFEAAIREAASKAQDMTELPLFFGECEVVER